MWSDEDFECSAILCFEEDLPNVIHGSFNCFGNSVVDKCILTCDNGFFPSSSSETNCKVNDQAIGKWSDEDFECVAILCFEEDLPDVTHGSFNCFGNSVGDKCILTCDNGFYPSSSSEAICKVNDQAIGKWSDEEFECSAAILCFEEDLPNVIHGTFNCFGNSVGDKCILTCADGFHPSSSSEAICKGNDDQAIGMWSDENFECVGMDCNGWNSWAGSFYRFIHSKQSWSDSYSNCQEENGSSHLVYIESEDENEFVWRLTSNCSSELYSWIGLTYEGEWKWGTEDVLEFHWGYFNGNPEPSRSTSGSDEDCGLIGSKSGRWFDFKCISSYPAVCELETNSE